MQTFNGKLRIKKSMNIKELSLALDTALFMGFESTSAVFPVTSYSEGMPVPESADKLKELFVLNSDIPVEYVSSTASARPIPEFKREGLGLEGLFLPCDFLKDEDNDCLPDKINFKIVLPRLVSDSMAEAACNFAFRAGMEVTACSSQILADESYEGNTVTFKESSFSRIYLTVGKYKHLNICCGKDIVDFLSDILNNFPHVSYGISWERYLDELKRSLTYKNLDGQLSFAKTIQDNYEGNCKAYCEPSCEHLNVIEKSIFNKTEFINYKGLKEAYSEEFNPIWECDNLLDILDKKLFPSIKAGDKIEIFASLSENREIRENLGQTIKTAVAKRQGSLDNLEITCAYKSGYSWIEEYVIPKLKDKGITKTEISFKPFLPQGTTQWIDEDGATPTQALTGVNNPDKWYDLPIRFLQELYPVDDLIASQLGISSEDVTFKAYDGKEDITYILRAYDKDGNITDFRYKVHTNEMPYLKNFPEMGKVHPSTGYVKVYLNGKAIIDESIKTDLENIWDIFNGEVLETCTEHIKRKYNGILSSENQPFFSCLKLEAYVSEPERKLPFRQDMISPLDALHEDMYFVASDYFKNLGCRLFGKAFDAPGLVLPVLHVRDGSPSFKVTLYDKVCEKPMVTIGDKEFIMNNKNVSCRLSEISRTKNGLAATVDIDGADLAVVKAYADLLEEGALHANSFLENIAEIRFRAGENEIISLLPKNDKPEKNISIKNLDFPEDRVIGYKEYLSIIKNLKHVKGLEVYEAARSYSDRIIYAVDIIPKNETGYISRTKRISKYPCQLVNCRHHANEVSSTNACFKIIKEILTNPEYEDAGDRINLTFVPVENTDGTAIHEDLSKDNPLWKLHVARFDAVGKEFFREIFDKNTIHTEAMAFTRLYEDKLPDLVVDNHGVPSHEWEQQFSGYTSPMFKGFWLPRSILYGYFWYVPQKEFKDNLILSHRIEHEVAMAIGKDKEMDALNVNMAGKFEKYAHNWMPRLFPADYYMHMINYWVKKDFNMNERYVSYRHPWITTTYYTSEVADETAQGEYLRLCTKAHFIHNMTIINIMKNAETVVKASTCFDGSNLVRSWVRQRPILVSPAEEI